RLAAAAGEVDVRQRAWIATHLHPLVPRHRLVIETETEVQRERPRDLPLVLRVPRIEVIGNVAEDHWPGLRIRARARQLPDVESRIGRVEILIDAERPRAERVGRRVLV